MKTFFALLLLSLSINAYADSKQFDDSTYLTDSAYTSVEAGIATRWFKARDLNQHSVVLIGSYLVNDYLYTKVRYTGALQLSSLEYVAFYNQIFYGVGGRYVFETDRTETDLHASISLFNEFGTAINNQTFSYAGQEYRVGYTRVDKRVLNLFTTLEAFLLNYNSDDEYITGINLDFGIDVNESIQAVLKMETNVNFTSPQIGLAAKYKF